MRELPKYHSYDEAQEAASRHRGRYCDDVILHHAEDYGRLLVCEDCGWTVSYVPDDQDYPL